MPSAITHNNKGGNLSFGFGLCFRSLKQGDRLLGYLSPCSLLPCVEARVIREEQGFCVRSLKQQKYDSMSLIMA